MAGAAFFSLNLGLKDKLSCTLGTIVGGCNGLAKQNRKAIKESMGYINAAQEQWTAVQNITNEKFFIVGKEIHELLEVLNI